MGEKMFLNNNPISGMSQQMYVFCIFISNLIYTALATKVPVHLSKYMHYTWSTKHVMHTVGKSMKMWQFYQNFKSIILEGFECYLIDKI